MKVLIDADVLIAAFDTSDSLHEKVSSLTRKLKDTEYMGYIGVNVLMEALTVISQALGIRKSLKLLDHFTSGNFEIVYLDEKLVKQANIYFRRRASKNVSYSDCLNLALFDQLELDYIFSFDKHYKQAGYPSLTEVL